jgi:hypothetical protein
LLRPVSTKARDAAHPVCTEKEDRRVDEQHDGLPRRVRGARLVARPGQLLRGDGAVVGDEAAVEPFQPCAQRQARFMI